MTIKQALKAKSKLIKKNSDLFNKVRTYNSIEEGTTRPYDPIVSLEEFIKGTNELIELKTKIHLANSKVYSKIFRLSELKSLVKQLQSIDCKEGKVSSYRSETPTVMTSMIKLLQKDEMINEYEEEIEKLQDELDIHNAKTKI